jgi:hypothetical protein
MNHSNRVLSRKGARELTREEMEFVGGSSIPHTNVCSFVSLVTTQTGPGDGDACGDLDH